MNVVFISPHFPLYFHNFCSRLKERGVNVLGIGDEDYNLISEETKKSVTEYYRVSNLENYEEVQKACKFYEHKYGKIDFKVISYPKYKKMLRKVRKLIKFKKEYIFFLILLIVSIYFFITSLLF